MREMIKLFNVTENSMFPTLADFANLATDLSGAHSDEPIGVLTQYYFIRELTTNPRLKSLLEKYTFICHPLVDPDGYELNSSWFATPRNFKTYFLNNFRNNHPAEDCEHGIPIQESQSARPEMKFLKNNLDLFKDRLQYYVTLHSSHVLPGACFVIDKDNKDTKLREKITKLCQAYDLKMMDYKLKGEETMSYLGPGFIGAPIVTSMLEHYKDHPEILSQIKMTTYEYAQVHCGAKSAFISELPIWLSVGFDDYSDSTMTLNDFKKASLENSKIYLSHLNKIAAELSSYLPDAENPWFKSLNTAL